MSLILTPAELDVLTGRIRYSAQAKQLRALGYDYRKRTDGSLVVLRSALEGNSMVAPQDTVKLNLEACGGP